MIKAVRSHLHRRQKQPAIIRNLFKEKDVQYAACVLFMGRLSKRIAWRGFGNSPSGCVPQEARGSRRPDS